LYLEQFLLRKLAYDMIMHMQITEVINLGNTVEEANVVKFVLLEDGTLLFGLCRFHKDLVDSYYPTGGHPNIVGAGTIPRSLSLVPVEDMKEWGNWHSTGFKVTVEEKDRAQILKSLLPYEEEVSELWVAA
jgi:hypothetical protein